MRNIDKLLGFRWYDIPSYEFVFEDEFRKQKKDTQIEICEEYMNKCENIIPVFGDEIVEKRINLKFIKHANIVSILSTMFYYVLNYDTFIGFGILSICLMLLYLVYYKIYRRKLLSQTLLTLEWSYVYGICYNLELNNPIDGFVKDPKWVYSHIVQ